MGRCRINNNFPVSSSRGLQTVRRCQYWKSQASWERGNLIRPKDLREYFLFTIIRIAWPWLDTFPIAIIYKGEVIITITFTHKSILKILHNPLLTSLFYLACICVVSVSILYFFYHVALDVSYDVVCISQLLHPVLKVFLSREFIRHFKEDTELSFKKIYTENILSLNNKTLCCSAFNVYSNYIVIFNYIADLEQNLLKIKKYIENVKWHEILDPW